MKFTGFNKRNARTDSSPASPRDAHKAFTEEFGMPKMVSLCPIVAAYVPEAYKTSVQGKYAEAAKKLMAACAMANEAELSRLRTEDPPDTDRIRIVEKNAADWPAKRDAVRATDVKDTLALFCAGIQVAHNALKGKEMHMPEISIVSNMAENFVHIIKARALDDGSDNHELMEHKIGIGLHLFAGYALVRKNGADKEAVAEARDQYKAIQRKIVEGGAEEFYHAYQSTNMAMQARFEKENKDCYGPEWKTERNRIRQEIAALPNEEERNARLDAFYATDPLEKDARQFMDALNTQLDYVTGRYQEHLRKHAL